MNTFKKQTSIAVTLLIAVVVCSLLLVGVVSMGVFLNQKYEEVIVGLENEAASNKKRALQGEVVALFNESETERAELELYVPPQDRVIDIVFEIERLATVLGVRFVTQDIITRPETEDSEFTTSVILIDYFGSREVLIELLSYLEELPYQTSFDQLSLEQDSGGVYRLEVALAVTVAAYDK